MAFAEDISITVGVADPVVYSLLSVEGQVSRRRVPGTDPIIRSEMGISHQVAKDPFGTACERHLIRFDGVVTDEALKKGQASAYLVVQVPVLQISQGVNPQAQLERLGNYLFTVSSGKVSLRSDIFTKLMSGEP